VLRYEGYAARTPGPVTIRELPCTFVPIIIDIDAGWTVAQSTGPCRSSRSLTRVPGSALCGYGSPRAPRSTTRRMPKAMSSNIAVPS